MKKVLKWIGIAAAALISLALLTFTVLYIYDSGDFREGAVKPGIAQEEIPVGVTTSVIFQNVNIVPMDSEQVLAGQSVVIEDGRITGIGIYGEAEVPTDAHIIDGKGKFLIPGLSDMHMHTYASENQFLVYLANGVTTVKEVGGSSPMVLEWRDQIRAGTRTGPDIYAFWPMLEENTWDDEFFTELETRRGKTWVHTTDEAEQIVTEMAALGVDGIKAHSIFSSEIYQALLSSAEEHNLPLDGHLPVDHTFCPDNRDTECACASKSECWQSLRAMNVPAVAHMEELIKVVAWDEETIQQAAHDVAEDGIWVTTTAYIMRSIAEQADDLEGALARNQNMKYIHPLILEGIGWNLKENNYSKKIKLPQFYDYIKAVEDMTRALVAAEGNLMTGTDAPVPLMAPGFSLHGELATLVDIGLTPFQALQASTYNPALYLGKLDEFGTVEIGKRADLILLDGNPLENIANTQHISGVMVRGRWFDRADLDTMLELVAADNNKIRSTQNAIEIAFPIVMVLLVFGLVWLVVRKIKRKKNK